MYQDEDNFDAFYAIVKASWTPEEIIDLILACDAWMAN